MSLKSEQSDFMHCVHWLVVNEQFKVFEPCSLMAFLHFLQGHQLVADGYFFKRGQEPICILSCNINDQ